MSEKEMKPAPLPGTPKSPDARRANGRRRRFDVRRDGKLVAIVVGAVLALNLGFWYVLVRPLENELSALRRDEENAGQARARSSERLGVLRETRDHARTVEAGVNSFFEEMLATRAERSVDFQRSLSKVGKEFGVRPQQVNIGFADLEQEGIEVMSVTFPIEGGYENLRRFLARLESLDQFLIVREVALEGGDEGGRVLRLAVRLETFFNDPTMREEQARQREWEKRLKDKRRSSGRGRR